LACNALIAVKVDVLWVWCHVLWVWCHV